jgi:GH24 family phage-related lysozyme (muramidase)
MKVSKKFVDWLSSWEGEEILKKDLIPVEKEVRKRVPKEWIKERRHFETMVALAYSVGAGVLTPNSPPLTPLAMVLKKGYTPATERSAGSAILMYKSRGTTLEQRRAEQHLFLHGNYRHKK